MGGNVFAGKTKPIKKENIEETVQNYFNELKKLFPKKSKIFNKKYFHYLGSVGKKPVSGDIDFGIDAKVLLKDFSDKSFKEWGINPVQVKTRFEKLKKRARTATNEQLMMKAFLQEISVLINAKSPNIYVEEKKVGPGTMFSLYPQFENGKKLNYGVQIDWMAGNIDLLKFSYYSSVYKGNVKGLHRTQLVLSMFDNAGVSFNHTAGLKWKDTGEFITDKPSEMIQMLGDLYNVSLNKSIVNDYFKLIAVVKSLPQKEKDGILNTYLKILDKTRADIPEDLHDEYRARKKHLGLTGKFLPSDSKLLKENFTKPKSFKAYLNKNN